MANNTDIAISRLTVDAAQERHHAGVCAVRSARHGPLQQHAHRRRPATDALAGRDHAGHAEPAGHFHLHADAAERHQLQRRLHRHRRAPPTAASPTSIRRSTAACGVNFTQPLIQNRGAYVNRLPIMIARSRLRKTEYDLRDTRACSWCSNAENAYWDLVLARENLRVQEKALDLADQALKRAQRELELGAMSPLDIYQPQQSYATAEIAVSQARYSAAAARGRPAQADRRRSRSGTSASCRSC